MNRKILMLVSLFALMVVSSASLATGRPSGIRIGRAAFGGNNNLEIDVTVNTYTAWNSNYLSTQWIGNVWDHADGRIFYHYSSSALSVPLPWAIDWGDGYYLRNGVVFGEPGGPYRGTFSHTYSPGSYTVTVGTSSGAPAAAVANYLTTGYVVTRYTTYGAFRSPGGTFNVGSPVNFATPWAVAITNAASVTTGTGIPALSVHGLLAMALMLCGIGLLTFRRTRTRTA